MEVDGRLERAEAVDVRAAAGMRPGRGRERAADDEHESGGREDEREQPQLTRDERRRAPVAKADRLDREHDGAGEQRDREQEVRHHNRPAKVAGDGEVAERRLREGTEQDEQGNPAPPAGESRRPPRREPRHERDRDHDAADEPVSELDEGVDVLLGERLAALASRPVAAPEPRVGQANRRAAADDQPEAGTRSRRELEEARRRELEAPDAGERGRGLHRL